jgi:GNAT superfamily N-acetyltransferase
VTTWRVVKLARSHAVDGFDCGSEPLDRFLIRHALQNQQANASQTYVALADEKVIGYFTLVVGDVSHGEVLERLTRGLARHPVPVMVLARLAVSTSWQGRGIGSALLRDAVLRTLQAADIAGIRALAIHAKDDAARVWYERFQFVAGPTNPLHLYALIKDLRHLIEPG